MESNRTRLRRFNEKDLDNQHRLECDPDITRHTSFRVPQTRAQTLTRLIGHMQLQPSREPFGIWAAEIKDTSEFLGWFMLMPLKDSPDLELGFMILPKFWNKGYTTEVAQLLTEFSKKEKRNLIAITTLDNSASIRVLEKSGFTFKEFKLEKDGSQLKVFELVHA